MKKSAAKIKWTEPAKDDMVRIRLYLKQNVSAEFARKVTQEIKIAVDSLRNLPGKGTFVPELDDLNMPDFRQMFAGQNRIIFERTKDIFYIHLVCHTSMNLESLLMQRHLK
ncbi:type II toxin-antitoxin system RelE/ParE family toxin [Massilia sp. CCM 8734]|uniref:type II toxin-antitoxin system RelE/ParE family toxin n=1 Tax=Massilia sp. CCM 8734 TaxID=2609283 RepID=UPI00141E8653|nr:type II toxin-antitoxin system RelE/ParE family toxin [Massilia sp. CCM 8734]NHZ99730.1 hypothetical protein [Massilia sp. CCM 8734]